MNQAVQAQERVEPTAFGIPLFQFLLGLLLFFAVLHSRKDVATLCLLVLGLMGCVRLWSALGLGGLSLSCSVDKQRVFPGEFVCLALSVSNTRVLPLWVQAFLAPGSGMGLAVDDRGPTRQCGLLGHEEVGFRWELAANGRGVYRLASPAVRVADPLGFFGREKRASREFEIVVYPRRVHLRSLPIPRREFFGHSGNESPVVDPIHILGTRDYQHSQPARHIHWKASARHDRLQEKVFEPSEQAKVLLLLDVEQFRREEAAWEFERTLEVVASLALELDRKGHSFGLATNGTTGLGPVGVLDPAKSPRQIRALLEVLARLNLHGKEAAAPLLQQGLHLPRGASCVHFGCGPDALPHPVAEYFVLRGVPLVGVVARHSAASEAGRRPYPVAVHRLEDLLSPEALSP